MQSSNVVRGSIRSECCLPLMRSVTGTAPSIFDSALVAPESVPSAALFADAGTYAATKLAATLLPEVKRNLRRVGSVGCDLRSSFDIRSPFEPLLRFQAFNLNSRRYQEVVALDLHRADTHRPLCRSANYGPGSHIELTAMTRARHGGALKLTLSDRAPHVRADVIEGI